MRQVLLVFNHSQISTWNSAITFKFSVVNYGNESISHTSSCLVPIKTNSASDFVSKSAPTFIL